MTARPVEFAPASQPRAHVLLEGLRSLPEVVDAVVYRRSSPQCDDELVGIVCGPPSYRDVRRVRQQLRQALPSGPMPDRLVVLEAMPLTDDGEHDLVALSRVAARAEQPGDADEPDPRTDTERELAQILAELFAVEYVGRYDSFFDLGGFSLLASRLIATLHDRFGVEVAMRDIFQAPTLEGLAELVAQERAARLKTRLAARLTTQLARHANDQAGVSGRGPSPDDRLAEVLADPAVASLLARLSATGVPDSEPDPAPRSSDGGASRTDARRQPAQATDDSSEIGTKLLAIVAEILGRQSVRAEDNFFECGGTSLLAVQLLGRIQQEFGVELGLEVMFQGLTVASLSRRLTRRPSSSIGSGDA